MKKYLVSIFVVLAIANMTAAAEPSLYEQYIYIARCPYPVVVDAQRSTLVEIELDSDSYIEVWSLTPLVLRVVANDEYIFFIEVLDEDVEMSLFSFKKLPKAEYIARVISIGLPEEGEVSQFVIGTEDSPPDDPKAPDHVKAGYLSDALNVRELLVFADMTYLNLLKIRQEQNEEGHRGHLSFNRVETNNLLCPLVSVIKDYLSRQ